MTTLHSIFAAAATMLAGCILFCAMFSNLLYWYEAISESGVTALREKFRRRLLPWALIRVVRTALTQAFVFCLWPLSPLFHRPVSGCGNCEKRLPPVLLIHGLYHNPGAWCLFRPRLMRAGFTNCRTFKYWSFATDYWSILDQLEREVAEYAAACGEPVCLVGHSLGGLLLRGLLARGRCRGQVLAAVTLGAPHQGSKLAALGLGRLARSLRFHGRLVDAIEELEKECSERRRRAEKEDSQRNLSPVPVLSLYSPIDNMVTPQQGLRLSPQAVQRLPHWKEVEAAPLDHVAMLYHRRTAHDTAHFLRQCIEGMPAA